MASRVKKGRTMLAVVLLLSLLIGTSLGLLGGGGSILTVPILTYVADMPAKSAIAASLFVVAATSAVGALSHARAGRVRWRTGLLFGAASMVGAYGGGRLAAYVPARVLLIAFALIMVAAAYAMLRKPKKVAPRGAVEHKTGKAILDGVLVGSVTGLVGAGGGFLVVPALVFLGGLSMEIAVGTSLLVIAMKSTAALAGHLGHVDIDWPTTLAVTAVAIGGSFIGSRLANRISPESLKRGFGVFVAVMAVWMLGAELFA